MKSNRRDFLKASEMAGGSLLLTVSPDARR
ncbi:MAG: twin-arginine translocation signal domain-containing protein [Anaerolineae bacterium]